MKNDDDIHLRHRLDAATEALRFTSGRQREDLEADRQLTWALIKAIEIIGEAAGQLSEETKTEHSKLPWRVIIGMRNRLVHAYFDINVDILWKTVIDGLPPLLDDINRALQEET